MDEWMDDDGYPTKQAIERIVTWPYDDLGGMLDFVESLWHWPHLATHELDHNELTLCNSAFDPGDLRWLRLATGGWSGNEELIDAMLGHPTAWALTWRLSARGGLHIFAYPEESDDRD